MNSEIQKNISNQKRIDSLQVIRAFAFLGIFTNHCYIGKFGPWGVSVFIVLSGFLMTYSYYGRNIEISLFKNFKFSVMKIKKLYFLHILMTIVDYFLTIPYRIKVFSFYDVFKQCIYFFTNFFLIQVWFPSDKIYFSLNGVAWYLSLCFFLYFAFPYILKYIKKLNSTKQAVLISVIIFSFQCLIGVWLYFAKIKIPHVNNFDHWVTYVFPIFRLGDFAIGCCFGYIFINRKRNFTTVVASIGEVLAILFVLMAQFIHNKEIGILGYDSFKYNMIFTISSVALVYLFAQNQGVFSRALTCKPLIYLGNISPYAFLIHNVFSVYFGPIINNIFGISLNIYIRAVFAFVLTIVCSEIYKLLLKRKEEKIPLRKAK